ncbi:MAG: DUF1616 domain-containing protein [Dehalococcoidales bacterium]|nr:DUF1616 domain-containing protein [Dehalococcoidales bacterium]
METGTANKLTQNRKLLAFLIIVIVGAVVMLGYTIAHPRSGDRFTEFYILGPNGKANDYPQQLVVGEEARVTVGIVNREGEIVSYRLKTLMNSELANELGPVTLNQDEKWEGVVSFTPDTTGDNQQAEFKLYSLKDGEPALKNTLYLRPIKVTEAKSED